jgi:hypothetical protein
LGGRDRHVFRRDRLFCCLGSWASVGSAAEGLQFLTGRKGTDTFFRRDRLLCCFGGTVSRWQCCGKRCQSPALRTRCQSPRSGFQHRIVTHAAGRQVGLADILEGREGTGVLFAIVVFPFDIDGTIVAHAI